MNVDDYAVSNEHVFGGAVVWAVGVGDGYAFDNDAVLPEMIQTSGGILNLEVYREGMEAPMTVQVRLRRLRVTSY